MDLREIGWGCVEWIQLAQDRDRWQALVNSDEPSGSGAMELGNQYAVLHVCKGLRDSNPQARKIA
jgi:hypothetical protein